MYYLVISYIHMYIWKEGFSLVTWSSGEPVRRSHSGGRVRSKVESAARSLLGEQRGSQWGGPQKRRSQCFGVLGNFSLFSGFGKLVGENVKL